MLEAEFQRLIQKAIEGTLTAGEQAHLLEEIARRLGPEARRAFERDWSRLRVILRALARPRPGPPPVVGIALVILALIAIGFAIWEVNLDLDEGAPPGSVPCSGNGQDTITRTADVTVWGARRSYNAAVAEAWAQCAVLKAQGVCTGVCENGNPCEPKPNIINVEQFTVWSWEPVPVQTRTIMEYNCQCTCA